MQVELIASGSSVQEADATPVPASFSHAAHPSPANISRMVSERGDARDQGRLDVAGFVALSRFAVTGMSDEVKQAFRQRLHRVDAASGFSRMEVLSPFDAPSEMWLITYWQDEVSYRAWHHSHLYQESHKGIPKGLRLVPKSVSIRFVEHVAS